MNRSEIRRHCDEHGLQIIGHIIDVVLDREEVTEEQVTEFLATTDPMSIYEGYIVSGINRLSDDIQELAEDQSERWTGGPEPAGDSALRD